MPSSVLSVRVSDTERNLLEDAAKIARTNLSDFVRRRAIESAELDLMEQRLVEIPAVNWVEFEQWLQAPAKEIPAIKRLSQETPVWEK
jgi:uncharacterized protein (DUF1778 family)